MCFRQFHILVVLYFFIYFFFLLSRSEVILAPSVSKAWKSRMQYRCWESSREFHLPGGVNGAGGWTLADPEALALSPGLHPGHAAFW